jgi:hypothetical protein
MNRIGRVVRYLWALPASAVGMLLAVPAVCAGATLARVEGVVEVAGGRLLRALTNGQQSAAFVAITFGHVVIGLDHAVLARVRAHEHVHVRQYERWGPLFFPLYLASSAIALIRGRHPYLDNVFEREARATS